MLSGRALRGWLRYANRVKCASCKGVAHPATGSQHSETFIVCGRCTRETWAWVRTHTDRVYRVGPKGVPKGERRFVSFYEAAGKR